MENKNNPFKLTATERLIEGIGLIIFIVTFVGSAIKLLFL
jgi:hypothetical protein